VSYEGRGGGKCCYLGSHFCVGEKDHVGARACRWFERGELNGGPGWRVRLIRARLEPNKVTEAELILCMSAMWWWRIGQPSHFYLENECARVTVSSPLCSHFLCPIGLSSTSLRNTRSCTKSSMFASIVHEIIASYRDGTWDSCTSSMACATIVSGFRMPAST
jgi:hypothetical protein